MKIKDAIKGLEASKEFKEWIKENYSSSLVHVFKMMDEANKDEWQIGYYNKNDTITTFVMGKDGIKIIPEAEIFKKPDTKIMKLSIEDVKVSLDDARKTAKEVQEKEYEKEKPIKEIIILQKVDGVQVYNITFVTHSFKTLNIKIDSKTGDIVKHELITLVDIERK